jgi:hypothetical protein
MFPVSSKEEDLERNMLEALDSVPLVSMHRFATRASRFADAYFHGFDGADAAWANKKYRGHRTLPPQYLDDLRRHSSFIVSVFFMCLNIQNTALLFYTTQIPRFPTLLSRHSHVSRDSIDANGAYLIEQKFGDVNCNDGV